MFDVGEVDPILFLFTKLESPVKMVVWVSLRGIVFAMAAVSAMRSRLLSLP